MEDFKIESFNEFFVSFETMGDGTCLLHSILYCFNKTYRGLGSHGKQIMARDLRNNLANVLEERIKDSKKTYYQNLSRGEILEISKAIPEMKLEFMQGILRSHYFINFSFLELISQQLDIDIYIINSNDGTVYMTGDDEIYYKKRRSIILKYIDQAHFESVGLKVNNKKIETLFRHDCYIIKKLRNIMKKKFD